ncbi:xylulokinase [Anopheles sinensis]|uniref:Xylulokinase n=1 Tax=Anopheles sinensis TaxID=74873 RepID=A0A084WK25_ANOSI|nr:xylulokinase [Anopheles sinensis]
MLRMGGPRLGRNPNSSGGRQQQQPGTGFGGTFRNKNKTRQQASLRPLMAAVPEGFCFCFPDRLRTVWMAFARCTQWL